MVDLEIVTVVDDSYSDEIVAMMAGLYAEDAPAQPVNASHFPLTLRTLVANPSRGRVIVFRTGSEICGYALLIPYWSNEFGGTLVFIDELFVKPASRNLGLG